MNDDCTIKISDFGLARSLKGRKDWDEEIKRLINEDEKVDSCEDEKTLTKSSSIDDLSEIELVASLEMVKKQSSIIRKGSDDIKTCMEINEEISLKKRISRALKSTEEDREKEERELTPHVVTRFYRAPEVILMDKNYNK